ncbi:MAG: dihydrofolate reductase [Burkholderiales bacterium]|nr:dihydrofolate reductase [Burkholderiales bacterium]
MATLVLIAAVARNGVVGAGGRLPWHLPEDLRHFRAATNGHPVIMGRRTWDSLPPRFRPLPGRRNLVVTRDPAWRAEGAEAVTSPEAALARVADAERAFVIGGAELWAAALPLADELLLTEIDRDFDGDACFPAFDRRLFVETGRERLRATPPNDFEFSIVSYRKTP